MSTASSTIHDAATGIEASKTREQLPSSGSICLFVSGCWALSLSLSLSLPLSLSLSFGRIICTELRRGGWIRQGRIRGIGEREPTRKLTRFASLFAASASRPRLLFPPSRTGTQKWKLRPDYNSLLHKTLSLSP